MAAKIAPAMANTSTVPIRPARKPAGPYQTGQRGRPSSSSTGSSGGVSAPGGREACSSSVVTAQRVGAGSSVSPPIVATPATGAAPSRAISTARMPIARAPAMSLSSESPTCRASPGPAPPAQRLAEDRGCRLGRPDHGGRHHAVEQRREPRALEHRGQRRIPVAGHHQPHTRATQLLEGRGGVRERVEVERLQQRLARLASSTCGSSSASRSTAAQRSRRSESEAGSPPSRWCAR